MKKIIRSIIKGITIVFSVFALSVLMVCVTVANSTPETYKVSSEEEIYFDNMVPLSIKSTDTETVKVNTQENKNNLLPRLMLFDSIPIKTVKLEVVEEKKVNLCGTPFGIKIFTDGVLVVGMTDVKTSEGVVCPGKEAGLSLGDVILTMNGEKVTTNESAAAIVSSSKSEQIEIEVSRAGQTFNSQLKPRKSSENDSIVAGLWLRDSSAGIGMLTYYDKDNGSFAGLGHGICDADTERLMPLLSGDIVNAQISSIVAAKEGYPGQLHGSFSDKKSIGKLKINGEMGVYGMMSRAPNISQECAVANKQDIKKGDAQILTTVDGDTPKLYNIRINTLNYKENNPTKNMVIQIVDEELLLKTGGIVQGMSGSPIIQDDKFVGAVTHVFVNEPNKGFAIFADNMINVSNEAFQENEAA